MVIAAWQSHPPDPLMEGRLSQVGRRHEPGERDPASIDRPDVGFTRDSGWLAKLAQVRPMAKSWSHLARQLINAASARKRAMGNVSGVLLPIGLAAVLVPARQTLAGTAAALILVALITAIAILGSRSGGLLASVSSALSFDFFLTRPYERLAISHRPDLETTISLFVVGVIVTKLAVACTPSPTGRRRRGRLCRTDPRLGGNGCGGNASCRGHREGIAPAHLSTPCKAMRLPTRCSRNEGRRRDAPER